VDDVTLGYLRLSGRPEATVKLVEAYCKAQGLWRVPGQEPVFTDSLGLDMGEVQASLAGPKRPQDRVALPNVSAAFNDFIGLQLKPSSKEEGRLESEGGGGVAVGNADQAEGAEYVWEGQTYNLHNGAVVIAAITSCTNTSNPSVMMAAGLVAKKAVEKGLMTKPWVKTSLAPGSKVVTDYYHAAGLTEYLDKLGFDLVGYGCTTCIGNSGPLAEPIEKAIQSADLTVASVLSGNRNFEGRVHPLVKTNWLASPPLVVAYALAGSVRIDISSEPLGKDQNGKPVYLRDIWPSQKEIAEAVAQVTTQMFHKEYAEVFAGDEQWQAIEVPQAATYVWQDDSTYIQHPPFFDDIAGPLPVIEDVRGASVLALLGDSVTTDHISPAGNIKADSPAGRYLREKGVEPRDFNSYGSRRGNHEVMMRGTFANIRIRNEMLDGEEGGNTLFIPTGEKLAIYDAAMRYQQAGTPLVVIAGQEYGTGSSRDWAAKGTNLLGVKAVIAESFERIHRSNLVGMGVLPLQFTDGQSRKSLKLTGRETLDIVGLSGAQVQPHMSLDLRITREGGEQETVKLLCRIDTLNEVEYFKAGGILHYVLRQLIGEVA
jgi:aconitate hydratase